MKYNSIYLRYQSIKQQYPGIIKIGENFNWLILDTLTRFAVGLFVGAWVARYLGPSQFGLLTFCQVVAGLVAVIPALGLDSILQREIIRYPQLENELLGTAFYTRLVFSLLTYILYFIGSIIWVEDSVTLQIMLIVGISMLNVAPRGILIWYQANLYGKYTMLSQNVALLIISAARIGCILTDKPLFWFAVLISVDQILSVIVLYFIYNLKGGRINKWNFSLQQFKKLIKESWPLLISGISVLVYMQSDQIMLKMQLDDKAVGIYSAAIRISTMFYFIPVALASSLFPTIVRSKKESQVLYLKRIQMFYDFNSAMGYLISFSLFFIAPWLIGMLFGESYYDSISILRIHIWSMIFVFLGMARESFIITEGYIKFSAIVTVLFAIVNICLNYFLIPLYGGEGAAVATLISYAGSALISSFFVSTMRKNGIMQLKSLLIFVRFKKYL